MTRGRALRSGLLSRLHARLLRRGLVPGLLLTLIAAHASCIATAPEGIHRETDGTGGAGGELFETTSATSGAVSPASSGAGTTDPHAVLGVSPPNGPFNGGQHALVIGAGFEPNVRVWLGDTEVTERIVIDPARVQLTTPPHAPGSVDVTTQNGDDESTRRSLPGAYTFDALYAAPSTGPVAGGTAITIFGSGAAWDKEPSLEARVDQKPCVSLTVLGPDSLLCTVPKGTPGAKSISVTASGGTTTALDAYTYEDSSDGFKGGLGGKSLNGTLKVLVFDNYSGDAIAGAHAIVGTDLATGLYQQADTTGVALFKDPSLTSPVTVTVTAKCHAPITFVDVPVDSVTVYLDPTLVPACAGSGDPPPVGGKPTLTGVVTGELVWPEEGEFGKGKWNNVPAPKSDDEERIAYVLFATRDRTRTFQLPSPTLAVTESSPGDFGYGFSMTGSPGNIGMYALAGLMKKSTGEFTAYVFGATKGVAILPGEETKYVYIKMTHALDQALKLEPKPPASGKKGPDRLHARVVIEVAQTQYAILPAADKTPLLPLAGYVPFVGLPPLDAELTGMRYVSSASAVTGPSYSAPLSVVASVATTSASVPVLVDGFVRIPELATPQPSAEFDGRHLAANYPSGGFPPDLTVYEVSTGGGVVRWLVVVPKANNAVTLPELSGFEDAGLIPGPLVIGVYGGRVDKFDYGKLTYRQMRPQGMSAYALDFFNSYL